MEILENIVQILNKYVWGWPDVLPLMVVALLSYGVYITLRLGFVQIKRFGHGVRVVMGKYDDPNDTGDVNHFQALTTALSATVGIGNIAGVAIAIHYGGPGALFWMWITAFLGMATKYSECTLAVMFRDKNPDGSVSGGPMYYIKKGLGNNWKWLAVAFASLAVICSFLTGDAVQANTIANTLEETFMISPWITGILSATIVGMVIIGGITRIGKVTARLMPIMAIIYVFGALVILMLNYSSVVPSFILIFERAFNPQAGLFGVGTGLFLTAMVWGVKRGLFSNEAGQGSAPIAHGAAKTEEPVREGAVALLEPFIDTLVICTITGLVILTTNVWQQKHIEPINFNATNINHTEQNYQINNGELAKGKIEYNGYEIDKIYTDSQAKTLFSGIIEVHDTDVSIKGKNGKEYVELYGGIIKSGAPLTTQAFENGLSPLMAGGRYIVILSVILFGISTSISWSYYGDRAIQFLLGDKFIMPYKIVYILMHAWGATRTLEAVWTIGDITLGLMTFPNLIALFLLSSLVARVTREYFIRTSKKELA